MTIIVWPQSVASGHFIRIGIERHKWGGKLTFANSGSLLSLQKNGRRRTAMGGCRPNCFLIALSASLAVPIVACGGVEKLPINDPRPSFGNAADGCSASRFSYLKSMQVVHRNRGDPIIDAAWVAAADAVGEQRDSFAAENCSAEVLAAPDQVRCFHFLKMQPTPGGAIQLCIDDSRKVSRLNLEE